MDRSSRVWLEYIYIYIPVIFQRIMFSKELPELHDYPFAPDKTEI